MANCLVTKLKESVDNNSLPQLGSFLMTFKSQTAGSKIAINNPSGYNLDIKSINNESIRFNTGIMFDTSNISNIPDNTIVRIKDDYYGVYLECIYITLESLEICKYRNLFGIGLRACEIGDADIKYLAYSSRPIEYLNIQNSHITGNIENLNGKLATDARIYINSNADLTGSIDTIVTQHTSTDGNVNFQSTGITISRSVYDAAIQRGVSINCTSSQIIEGQ